MVSKFFNSPSVMLGYFKTGNVSCHVVADPLLFICKIHVAAISKPYLGIIAAHHPLDSLPKNDL